MMLFTLRYSALSRKKVYAIKLIIVVELVYRDYERSQDFGEASQACLQEPVLVDWPTHDFRQLYNEFWNFCQ